MNKIYANQTGGFPLTTDTLNFLQESYNLFNVLGQLAGNLSIIAGCEITGSNVGNGAVYINGEVLPFVGGTLSANVVIKETIQTRAFENGEQKQVYFTRYATFGIATTSYKWADFIRVDNLQKLMQKIQSLVTDLNAHTHAWAAIQGKPAAFPPESHSHAWNAITGKPGVFPPATHTHSFNDLTDKPEFGGQVVIAGKIGCNPRRVLKKFAGNFSVAAYPQHSGWDDHHKIIHNLGHTDYVVTGAALGGNNRRTIKLNCFYMAANYCYVVTADDDTANYSDFVFQITSFK